MRRTRFADSSFLVSGTEGGRRHDIVVRAAVGQHRDREHAGHVRDGAEAVGERVDGQQQPHRLGRQSRGHQDRRHGEHRAARHGADSEAGRDRGDDNRDGPCGIDRDIVEAPDEEGDDDEPDRPRVLEHREREREHEADGRLRQSQVLLRGVEHHGERGRRRVGAERHHLDRGGRPGESDRRDAGADPHHQIEQHREQHEDARRHDDVERERAHDAHAYAHREAEAEREHAVRRQGDDPVQQHRDRSVDRAAQEHQRIAQRAGNPADAERECHGEDDHRDDGAIGGRPDRIGRDETDHPLRDGGLRGRDRRRRRGAAQRRRCGRVDCQPGEHRGHDRRGEGAGDGQEPDEERRGLPARPADGSGIILARDAHDELRDHERQDRHQDRVDPQRPEHLHHRAHRQQCRLARGRDGRACGQADNQADEGLRAHAQSSGSALRHVWHSVRACKRRVCLEMSAVHTRGFSPVRLHGRWPPPQSSRHGAQLQFQAQCAAEARQRLQAWVALARDLQLPVRLLRHAERFRHLVLGQSLLLARPEDEQGDRDVHVGLHTMVRPAVMNARSGDILVLLDRHE